MNYVVNSIESRLKNILGTPDLIQIKNEEKETMKDGDNNTLEFKVIVGDKGDDDYAEVKADYSLLCTKSKFFATREKSGDSYELIEEAPIVTGKSLEILLGWMNSGKMDASGLDYKEICNLIRSADALGIMCGDDILPFFKSFEKK